MVAKEILTLIEMLEKKYRNSSVALKALKEVKEKAQKIKGVADLGWY